MKELIKKHIKSLDRSEAFDISDIRKSYKRENDVRPDRADVVDACIELRKEGIIRYNLERMVMEFV